MTETTAMNRRRFLGTATLAAVAVGTSAAIAAEPEKEDKWEPTPLIGFHRGGRTCTIAQVWRNAKTGIEEWRPVRGTDEIKISDGNIS